MNGIEIDLGCGNNKQCNLGLDIKIDSDASIFGSIEHLPFRLNVFNRVYLVETLEHLFKPLDCLKEIMPIIRDEGKLIITIPNVLAIKAVRRWYWKSKITVAKEHIYGWRICEIENLLNYAGFKLIKFSFTTFKRFHRLHSFAKIFPKLFHKSLVLVASK